MQSPTVDPPSAQSVPPQSTPGTGPTEEWTLDPDGATEAEAELRERTASAPFPRISARRAGSSPWGAWAEGVWAALWPATQLEPPLVDPVEFEQNLYRRDER